MAWILTFLKDPLTALFQIVWSFILVKKRSCTNFVGIRQKNVTTARKIVLQNNAGHHAHAAECGRLLEVVEDPAGCGKIGRAVKITSSACLSVMKTEVVDTRLLSTCNLGCVTRSLDVNFISLPFRPQNSTSAYCRTARAIFCLFGALGKL